MLHRKKNIVLMLKRSIVEKLIVQSGWELKNGRSKNTSQRTFATFICIGGIKAKSLLHCRISVTSAVNSPRSIY